MKHSDQIRRWFLLGFYLSLSIWSYIENNIATCWLFVGLILTTSCSIFFGIDEEHSIRMTVMFNRLPLLLAKFSNFIHVGMPKSKIGINLYKTSNFFTIVAALGAVIRKDFYDGIWFPGSLIALFLLLCFVALAHKTPNPQQNNG